MTWNVIGAVLPLGVAVWAIPKLIQGLGPERFGLLTLIWVAVGYFSLFDLGFARALTKLVAQRLGEERYAEIDALAATALKVLVAIGVVVGAGLAAGAPWLVDILTVPDALEREATISLVLTALTIPVVMATAGLVGLLQAHQRFFHLSVVQAALGVATFGGPLLALQASATLPAVTLVLVASRVAAWIAYRWHCRDVLSGRPVAPGSTYALGLELFRFGGWVTLSNLVGPIMVYSDRFLIAAMLTMTAVTHYTTPYEMITRLWVPAEGLVAVVFPAIAMALARDGSRARWLMVRSTRMMTLMMVVAAGLAVMFSRELLTVWLGSDFARESSAVLRWLAVGVFINSVARLPFALLQASGRPDVTATLHLVELPLYLIGVWALVGRFGIQGAAAAWTLRALLDAAFLFTYGLRFVPEVRGVRMQLVNYVGAALVLLVCLTLVPGGWPKAVGAVALVSAACYLFLQDLRVVLAHRAPAAAS